MDAEKELLAKMLGEAEAEKLAIEGHINYLKKKLGISSDVVTTGTPTSVIAHKENQQVLSDSFFGLTISDAVRKYLEMVKRPKTTKEIVESLERGGLTHQSKSLYSTVASIISRKDDDFVNVGKGWGLVEWYPGRKKAKNGDSGSDKEEEKE